MPSLLVVFPSKPAVSFDKRVSPRATSQPKGTEAHTLSECYSHQKLSKDISQCLIPLTAHTQNSTPRAKHGPKGTEAQPSQNALINKLGKDISQCLIPVTVHIPDSSPRAKRVVDDDPSSLLRVLRLVKPGDPVIVRFIFRAVRDISVFIALASNPRLTTQIFFP